MERNIKYKFSDIAEFDYECDQIFLSNIITKERFKVTPKVAEILSFIRDTGAVYMNDIRKKYEYIDKNDLDNVFSFFIRKKIIINAKEEPIITVIKSIFPLFKLPTEEFDKVKNSFCVMGVPYGKGNMVDTGTFLYPEKVRFFSNKYGLVNKFQSLDAMPIYDIGNIYFYENEYSKISYWKIQEIVRKIIKNNNKLFCLGGDHSITYPIINEMAKRYKFINLIHFDAHTDFYHSKINDLHEEKGYCSHHHGNFIKKIVELDNVKNIYQFGVRNLNDGKYFLHEKIYSYGINEENLFLQKIKENSSIPTYLSFDIDVIDPIYAPATATPVVNGITVEKALSLISSIKQVNLNIIGIDLVEINPNKDIGNTTMQNSIRIIKKLMYLI